MAKIFICRHGETEWNVMGRWQGHEDSALTETGKNQARLLGAKLSNISFSACYSSPSIRALSTAELILGKTKVPFILEDDLKEISVPLWEGLEKGVIAKNWPDEWHRFFNAPHTFRLPEAESLKAVRARALDSILKIHENHRGENVLVVSHSVTLKVLLNHLKKQPLSMLWAPPRLENTCLSILNCNGESPVLELEGCRLHLNKER